MKFLYTTDLHGKIYKYETVLKYAIEHKITLLHIGADILPKGKGMLKKQKKFIKGYLKNFISECLRNSIQVSAFFGNDDIYTRKKYFKEYSTLLDETPFKRSGYNFKAYGYVPDHHFLLKNGTKLDRYGLKPVKIAPRTVPMPVFGSDEIVLVPFTPTAVDAQCDGFHEIENLEDYFKYKGSIKDDLDSIRVGSKTIMATHTPPAGLNLDVCGHFKKRGKPKPSQRVGSESLLKWILKKQPLLVLCGHIHENFIVTGSWKAMVGNTTVIQPGQHLIWKNNQKKKTTFVDIEITGNKVKAERIEI
jgi:Icc-related predicted phosphoesterase